MGENPQIRILDDAQSVASSAADEFVRLAQSSVGSSGRFTVALSGGSTPRTLYSLLADRTAKKRSPEIPWPKVHLFFGDERHVSPDHPDSNFRMANEAMISKVPIPPENVHRVHAENEDAAAAALQYDETIAQVFALKDSELPRFDLVLLGMGPDGHTASLFPGTRAVHELRRRVVANWVPKFNTFRITLTRPVLNNAGQVILLVCGADKAQALSQVMGSGSPDDYPVKYIRPTSGRLLWLLDKAAAEKTGSTRASGT